MAPRIYDQTLFRGQGALITFGALLTGHPDLGGLVADLKDRAVSIYLRWQVNPMLGLPSEPFRVWRRPAMPLGDEAEIAADVIPLPPLGRVVAFAEPLASVSMEVQGGAAPSTVVILPLADGVGFDSVLGTITLNMAPNAARAMTFQAPYITGLWILGPGALGPVRGFPVSAAEKIQGWEPVETVGFPVEQADWAGLAGQSHGVKQGLTGQEVPAPEAAAQRYARGINPFGWRPQFPTGETAPIWGLPPAADMIAEAGVDLLPMLRDALARAPDEQAAFTRNFAIQPPQSPSGDQMSGPDGAADVAPLGLLQLAVSTDPLQAVILGFGTGYAYEDAPTVNLGAISLFGDPSVSDWDYLVTGLWARGADGRSDPVEFAALIPRPRKVVPPPQPADLRLDFLGHHQPPAADQPWTAAVRLSWERFVLDNLSAVASFAVGRADLTTAGPAEALMERRSKGVGHLPIGDTRNPLDPETVRQSASDGAYPIPNDPGSVNARYGVATQNIFGIWSPWATHAFQSAQPDPDPVHIIDAALVPVDPGAPATMCPATLTVEFVLDWRVRRVQTVVFEGRLFAAANRQQDPPAGFPAGVQKTAGGPATPVSITFAGDVPTGVGASVVALDAQGQAIVVPGAATQGPSRRYRMTVTGFALDYAATPHYGLALRAGQTERLAPQRTSAASPAKLTYASDPRARPTTVVPVVPLASLPDAAGQCHARLAWAALPAAEGYAVYASNEIALLTRTGAPHPAPGATLSDRLVALKAAFNANPERNAFTRVNDALVKSTSMDALLPRGSRAIECWVVLPVGAGGIEGPWPSGPAAADALIVYAAPKVAEPAPPRIEVRSRSDGAGFAASVRVETRGAQGARPARIALYRTRVTDAARQVDSMGFPIAEIASSGGGWTVARSDPGPDGWVESVAGLDAPGGSWRHVWYRAVAWAEADPERGVLGGRSLASPAAPVVVPPAGPPALGALIASWPGDGPGDVQFDFTTAAPLQPTPLGPHLMQVDVVEQGVSVPLLRAGTPLHLISATPPAAPASGLWRVGPDAWRLLVRRTDAAHPASVAVRLIDPIGRTSERTHRIAAGSMLPTPVLSPITSFSITGRGKVFSFTIDGAPDDPTIVPPYVLRVTLTPARAQPTGGAGGGVGGLLVRRGGTGRPGGLVAPTPGPALQPAPARGAQFVQRDGALVYESALRDVPTAPPAETFAVSRQRVGDRVTITLTTRGALRRVLAEVIAPDGGVVSRAARG